MSIAAKLEKYLYNHMGKANDKSLKVDTPLLDSGILDSISALLLVDFVEAEFDIEFLPHEVSSENLNSISILENFIKSKQG